MSWFGMVWCGSWDSLWYFRYHSSRAEEHCDNRGTSSMGVSEFNQFPLQQTHSLSLSLHSLKKIPGIPHTRRFCHIFLVGKNMWKFVKLFYLVLAHYKIMWPEPTNCEADKKDNLFLEEKSAKKSINNYNRHFKGSLLLMLSRQM